MQHYCKFSTFVFLTMNTKINWDMMGIATSVLCAIHCALLPVLVSTLPVFGINIVHNSVFEWGMIILAFIVGSYSLFHGYVKHHHSLVPVLIFCVGFLLLVFKQFFMRWVDSRANQINSFVNVFWFIFFVKLILKT